MNPTLCFITAHYQNTDEVRRYVEHVRALPLPVGWERAVMVVDNSGTWPQPEAGVREGEPIVWVPPRNLGYLNGCAWGLEQWAAEHSAYPDWWVVSNPDVTFASDVLLRALETAWPDDTGIVAPSIETPDGLLQNPFLLMRPSRLRVWLEGMLYRTTLGQALLRRSRYVRGPVYAVWQRAKQVARRFRGTEARDKPGPAAHREAPPAVPLYAPHGSALLFRRRYLDAGARLAMPWFLFGEEIHLAEQARRAQLRILWAPHLRVRHESHTTLRHVDADQVVRWKAESRRGLWETYFR